MSDFFKFTLKKTFSLLFGFQLFLIICLGILILLLYQNQQNLAKSRDTHFNSYLLADELRQSSDDLTRMARAYVATGNPEFERDYWTILDIRNGKVPRPVGYNRIYWDFFAATGEKPRPDSETVSLQALMIKEGFTSEEFAKLAEAQRNSDALVETEMVAMNAVKGLFKDEDGNFTIQKEPDFILANDLMNNENYYKIKAEIMRPIDDFYALFETRTSQDVANYLRLSNILFWLILILAIFLFLLSGHSFAVVRRQITERQKSEQGLVDLQKDLEQKIQERTKKITTSEVVLKKTLAESEQAKIATLNILEDVEQEKEKSQALAADLEKFKLAVDNASDHIVITDREGIVVYGNLAMENITGYSIKEVVGKKMAILWKVPMPQEFYEKFWDTIKNKKKVFVGDIKNRRKNGEIYDAKISVSPIIDASGQVVFFVGIERDITKEKEVDKAKTEFVSLASHQLRTPLSAINWYAEMLLAGDAGKLNDDQKKFVDEIYRGNQRMVDLVNALLNVSRLELGTFIVEPKPCQITEIADSVLEEIKPQIKTRKQKMTKEYDVDFPIMQLDEKLIRIVLQNLLTNAVKYTPEAGSVKLEIRRKTKTTEIIVSDTGLGIPKAQQNKIFSKLFRADNVRSSDVEGTGLGLYIVKAIVDQSGGTIKFESEENKGTKFVVTLPIKGMTKKEGTKSLS